MTRREMTGTLAAAVAALLARPAGASAPAAAAGVQTLLQEPLEAMPNPEVRMIILTVAPGATGHPHKHVGPVFAYILEGDIVNQVDPGAPKTYKAGDYFYEPAMHVHRQLHNLSPTAPARLLIVEVGPKGEHFTLPAA